MKTPLETRKLVKQVGALAVTDDWLRTEPSLIVEVGVERNVA
jgi:hypothetical protein